MANFHGSPVTAGLEPLSVQTAEGGRGHTDIVVEGLKKKKIHPWYFFLVAYNWHKAEKDASKIKKHKMAKP